MGKMSICSYFKTCQNETNVKLPAHRMKMKLNQNKLFTFKIEWKMLNSKKKLTILKWAK